MTPVIHSEQFSSFLGSVGNRFRSEDLTFETLEGNFLQVYFSKYKQPGVPKIIEYTNLTTKSIGRYI